MAQRQDPELIAAAREGNRAALDALLESLWPHAYRIAHSIVQSDSLAQDAAQEACATLCNSIGSLRETAAFNGWFFRIVVRCAMAISRDQPQTSCIDDLSIAAAQPQSGEPIDMRKALGSIPPSLRTPLILQYYSGFSSSEIATIMRIPSATVRFRIAVAKRRLRPLLEVRNASHTPTLTQPEVMR